MFLNVCKQTFPISHVRISQKVKGVLLWNLQHIIFKRRQRYCQIFKSALVYLSGEWEEGWTTILYPNYIFLGYYFKLNNHLFRTFFLFYIKNRGESRLSSPSFGNIPWEWGANNMFIRPLFSKKPSSDCFQGFIKVALKIISVTWYLYSCSYVK